MVFSNRRNPLSLDMGWKKERKDSSGLLNDRSQSAFAGYGLEATSYSVSNTLLQCRNPLSLDMGWKVMKNKTNKAYLASQSAFAGYGLEVPMGNKIWSLLPQVAIRFRWIWVGRKKRRQGRKDFL